MHCRLYMHEAPVPTTDITSSNRCTSILPILDDVMSVHCRTRPNTGNEIAI